jgi:carbonic anhydrase/acetyltransferase-like protein (isoleucine patch superfamily)
MMLRHQDKEPQIAPTARIDPSTVICGDVVIGNSCSIGFGCVVTAESAPVRIGSNCVGMDGSLRKQAPIMVSHGNHRRSQESPAALTWSQIC